MALKDVKFPFQWDSEEEVRVAVALYFKELGFELSEMSFEDSFQIEIGHNVLVVNKNPKTNKVGGRSDLLLMRNGSPLAIVETKDPEVTLTEKDLQQGLSYARLLTKMPPYTIITNGDDFNVYDTVTTNQLISGTPTESTWFKNGSKYNGLSEGSRQDAIRTLFGLDFEIFKQYCRNQVNLGMADLKSSPQQRRRYSPDLYVQRTIVRKVFSEFLNGPFPCFGIFGDSGIGKSNEICAMAEEFIKNDDFVVLFYRAEQFWNGFSHAIKNDFEWEFERDYPISQILKKYGEIVKNNGAKLLIFIDGLDEFPNSYIMLRSELIDLVNHTDATTIRLCFSCKSYDWSALVTERGDYLNILGRKTYPPPSTVTASNDLDDKLPGLFLNKFNDKELDEAWSNYSNIYQLTGQLLGETRQECFNPIILKLVSETFQQTNVPLPSNLSNIAIFDKYWTYLLNQLERGEKIQAEKIATALAEKMIKEGRSEVFEEDFTNELNTDQINVYEKMKKYGIVNYSTRADETNVLTFPFDKLRSYVYLFKAEKLKANVSDRELAEKLEKMMTNKLGIEALIFYLTISDSTVVLTKLATIHLALTFRLLLLLPKPPLPSLSAEVNKRIQDYISFYALLRNLFPNLKEDLTPYTVEGEAGLWLHENWYGYRTRTSQYPHLVLSLDDETFGRLFNHNLNNETLNVLRPVYGEFSNNLVNTLLNKFPSAAAHTFLSKQLLKLIEDKQLNEATALNILVERVISTIENEPQLHFANSPSGSFRELLNFETLEEALQMNCKDLLLRIDDLIGDWWAELASNAETPKSWYEVQMKSLSTLKKNIDCISKMSSNLPHSPETLTDLFAYMKGNMSQTLAATLAIVPKILEDARNLLEYNFPEVANSFSLSNCKDQRLLLEVCSDPDSSFLKSEYLHLSYIWLPSAPTGPIKIRYVRFEDSLAERFIVNIQSLDNIFAKNITLSTDLDGLMVHESKAVISRVRFPKYLPITDQVYQLIKNEWKEIFGSNFN